MKPYILRDLIESQALQLFPLLLTLKVPPNHNYTNWHQLVASTDKKNKTFSLTFPSESTKYLLMTCPKTYNNVKVTRKYKIVIQVNFKNSLSNNLKSEGLYVPKDLDIFQGMGDEKEERN